MPDNLPTITSTPALTLMPLIERILANPDFPIETIERIVKLGMDAQSEQQRCEYNDGLARVQAEIEPVFRRRKNTHSGSTWAPYEDIMAMLQPILDRHSFSIVFGAIPGAPEGYMRMEIAVSRGGHTERRIKDMKMLVTGARGNATQMTEQQMSGAVDTYAKRYLVVNFFNIATTDVDDDGEAGRETVTQQTRDTSTAGNGNGTSKRDANGLRALRELLGAAQTQAGIDQIMARETIAAWRAGADDRLRMDIDLLVAEAGQRVLPAKLSDEAKALTAEIDACADLDTLNTLLFSPEFSKKLVGLFPPDRDAVDAIINARTKPV